MDTKALLRLHIEAVWDVQLPPIQQNDIELTPGSFLPAWKLYVAKLADARVYVWRPDVGAEEREVLRLRASEALALPPPVTQIPGVSREVALYLSALPKLDSSTARNIARPLTDEDRPLVEAFQANSSDDYLREETYPLVGIIQNGRLLSLAHSSRRTIQACELGIDTLPEARQKGYALAATVVWTQMILQEGLVPLYSAEASNTPSLRLAAAAGYRVFVQGTTFEV